MRLRLLRKNWVSWPACWKALAVVALPGLMLASTAMARAAAPEALVKQIKEVGQKGKGNAESAQAWKELTAMGPKALLPVLQGMDDDDLISGNWLRAAAGTIAERARQTGKPLPVKELEAFLEDRMQSAKGRRIAYEILTRADPEAKKRWLPKLLLDPSPELRRDGVAYALEQAEHPLDLARSRAGFLAGMVVFAGKAGPFLLAREKETAKDAYKKALSGAVDQDQVDEAARNLERLGVKVDLARHFGFVRQWYLATPFDNVNKVGFDVAYPPEKEVSLKATYKGKDGTEVKWAEYTADDPYGKVDLNKALGKLKGSVAYAYAVIDSPTARPVEIRAGSYNAIKIFLNGKEVFGREEYHHGMRLDQHVAPAMLKKGKNELLLKICQNEQTESWAQSWIFQVRICDRVGVAVPFAVVKQGPGATPGKDSE